MNEYQNKDAALFDHIHSALVGELPSFGMGKESKFQHLMQRNPTSESQVRTQQNMSETPRFSNYDTNLSVDAKAFRPGNQPTTQSTIASTINSFDNLDLAADVPQKAPFLNQPNPSANEFIPRNLSAPMLHHNKQNGGLNIREFIPSRQQGIHPLQAPYHDSSTPRLPQHIAPHSRSSNAEFTSGLPMSSSMVGPDLSNNSVFATPPSQGSSAYYTPDSIPSGYSGAGSFPRQPIDSLASNQSASERNSPLLMRRMGAQNSSMNPSSMSISIDSSRSDAPPHPITQESRGTTYFYSQKSNDHSMSVMMPAFHIFPGPPPSVEYMTSKTNAPSFFLPAEIRRAIMHKHALAMMTVDGEQAPSIPSEVDNYHSLFPLEAGKELKPGTFGFVTSCYKAIKYKDGLPYCLRRIHGFRQVGEKCMALVEMWKKLQHSSVVQLREVFTSNAFGEHSLVFAHDYHAGAETLMSRHFKSPTNTYASKAKWVGGTTRQNAGLLPESLIWIYVVQLTSALRCIHSAGLACRMLDLSKIIITDKSRLRINGVGILDVLRYDDSHGNPRAHMQQYQQDDMIALGRVVLALACNSITSCQPENVTKSVELVIMNYSNDLKNLLMYLLTPQQRPLSVNDVMPMIGARFYTHLDSAMLRADVIENELAKELENGRLFRMICKLGVINERPEFGVGAGWSETGDRYLLKLFRDHLFHQVTDTGSPWIDMSHVVQSLNKLDAGVPEKVCLMSRDEQNVLVVSYNELKKAFNKCYQEVAKNPPAM